MQISLYIIVGVVLMTVGVVLTVAFRLINAGNKQIHEQLRLHWRERRRNRAQPGESLGQI